MRQKDVRVQIYYRETERQAGSTVDTNYRHYVYSEKLYKEGGVYCLPMGLQMTDSFQSGLETDKIPVRFTVNRNYKITNKCKVIFDGEYYDISYIDPYDFRSPQMTFVAVKSTDTAKYAGDRFEE